MNVHCVRRRQYCSLRSRETLKLAAFAGDRNVRYARETTLVLTAFAIDGIAHSARRMTFTARSARHKTSLLATLASRLPRMLTLCLRILEQMLLLESLLSLLSHLDERNRYLMKFLSRGVKGS